MKLAEVLADPELLAPHFAGESWARWHTIARALEAEPPAPGDRERFEALTARTAWPTSPPRELWCVVGRRGGKTRFASAVAVYRAAFFDYAPHLAAGERATVMLLATDRTQARVAMRYVRGLLRAVPMLSRMIERETTESLDLRNRASIEIHTASFRATRGYTLACVVCDEVAFWRDESSANPADEILAALRPGLATIPGAPLVAIGSPYARTGPLWATYERHFGKDASDVLVIQAPTRDLNPRIPAGLVERALEADPDSARAEYLAEFRRDVSAFLAADVVAACIVPGRHELPPQSGVQYRAFVDPSGGSQDAMTLAVAHAEGSGEERVFVLDAVREVRPPFSPDGVAQEFAALLRGYGLREVEGDRYGGAWPAERFAAHGITYRPAALAKSDLYREVLPLLNAGRVELLDVPRLRAQLLGLERRVARGGRDSIDHGPGAHDDVANAAAGVLYAVARSAGSRVTVHEMLW